MTATFIAEPYHPLHERLVAEKSSSRIDDEYIQRATWRQRAWFSQTWAAYEYRSDQRSSVPCNPVATTRVT